MIKFIPTEIPEVLLIKPQVISDERGFFMETFHQEKYCEGGICANFVQDNHSASVQGCLRGLHYQIRQAQGKLVRVVMGEIVDVAVDLRKSSATFGKWVRAHLSAQNKHQLWIPEGFAHGFYTLSERAEVLYKATDFYAPQWERTLLWNDPQLGIDWQISDAIGLIMSEKDAAGNILANAELFD